MKKLLLFVGVTIATYVVCKKVSAARALPLPDAKPFPSEPSPYVPPTPGPSPSPNQNAPLLFVGDPMPLDPGKKCYATITVGLPASLGASVDKIKSLAQEKGFTYVTVSETKPANWPGRIGGDYYVSGLYQGSPTMVSRNPGPGVNIVEAFVQ